jgi:hypothetical protein
MNLKYGSTGDLKMKKALKMPMSSYLKRFKPIAASLFCCLLAMSVPAKAEANPNNDRWKFGGSVYIWGSGVKGTSAQGDEIDVSFSEVVEDLDGAIMGIIAAQKGKWGFIADMIYLSISQDTSVTSSSNGQPVKVDTDVTMQSFITTFGAAYRVFEEDNSQLDLLVGARYIYMDVDLDGSVGPDIIKYDDSDSALDGIVGLQGKVQLNDKWYLSLYADVGAGDSELTWQAWPVVGYKLESFDVSAGYRHLEWETDDGEAIDDVSFSGPMLGMSFYF